MKKIKVGIWGSTGYQGEELIKLLSKKEVVDIVYKGHSKNTKAKEINKVDFAFLALPAVESMFLVPRLLKRGVKIIDLSGAYRLHNPKDYLEYYDFKHQYPELIGKAVYGLPEINRNSIRYANFVANPGCYATGMELSLRPLTSDSGKKLVYPYYSIIVEAFSGYSGAGKDFEFSFEKAQEYAIRKRYRKHQHIPEVEQELNIPDLIQFFPNICCLRRGISMRICAVAKRSNYPHPSMLYYYQKWYEFEKFVRVEPFFENKSLEDVTVNTNFCKMDVSQDDNFVTIIVSLDNLGKGGAGQAVQNFNLMCGLPEDEVY